MCNTTEIKNADKAQGAAERTEQFRGVSSRAVVGVGG